MAVRGFILAKTGWTLEYINSLSELHLLFAFHWLNKVEEDTWERLTSHLGTVWDRDTLEMLNSSTSSGTPGKKIFVPLSLSINPDLPAALLGKKPSDIRSSPGEKASQQGDGLYTGMAMPEGDDVINMGDLPREEFMGLVANAGLTK